MKSLLIAFAFVAIATQTAFSAEVLCGLTDGNQEIPLNKTALDLAKDVGVKTCKGKRFQRAIALNKHTYKLVQATEAEQNAYIDASLAKKTTKAVSAR